jgi:hypothetical protein
MSIQIRKSWCALVLMVALSTANAKPTQVMSRLLRLVPAGAEIVAGIADPGTPFAAGRLLLVTENNNRDLDDCFALLGVDAGNHFEGVVEVASSSSAGDLEDDLLLLAGRFDGHRIFRAALENGAARAEYDGVELVVIPPFPREEKQMWAVRWMAILNDNTLVFGVPGMVKKALDRHQWNDAADSQLIERLAQMHPDVNSWSLIAMASPMLERHLIPSVFPESWREILTGADGFALGIHYGRTARVDFAIHTRTSTVAIDSQWKQGKVIPAGWFPASETQKPSMSVGQHDIRGSFSVREKEFNASLVSIGRNRSQALATTDK